MYLAWVILECSLEKKVFEKKRFGGKRKGTYVSLTNQKGTVTRFYIKGNVNLT
jgi:hypothetical protein